MLDWHSCQICYPLEIKILLLLLLPMRIVLNFYPHSRGTEVLVVLDERFSRP